MDITDFDLSSAVDRYLITLNSNESIRTQRSKLKSVQRILGKNSLADVPWADLEYDDIELILATLKREGKTRNTINATISAIKGVYNQLFKKRQIDFEHFTLINDIKSVKGDDSKIGKVISQKDVNNLFIKNPQKPIEYRNNAIFAVLVGCGLRRIEVCNLSPVDIKTHPQPHLIVQKGKGGKNRKVYIPLFALEHIKIWNENYRTDADRFLFSPVSKSDRVGDKILDTKTIYDIVKSKMKTISPHDLRRTFITRLLEMGNDLSTVQKIAGHSSPVTTVRYDKRDETQKIEASMKLHY